MNIEIIKISSNGNLEQTKQFGMFLNQFLSSLKMLHWYTTNYDAHKILGNDYEKLSDIFDSLQEEIIGTCQSSNIPFPMPVSNNLNDLDYQNIIESYKSITDQLKNNINSLDFNNYLTNVSSGINNTKEEILSQINKTLYLLSLIKF